MVQYAGSWSNPDLQASAQQMRDKLNWLGGHVGNIATEAAGM